MIQPSVISAENQLLSLLTGEGIAPAKRNLFFKNLVEAKYSDSDARAIFTLLGRNGEKNEDLLAAWNAIREAEKTAIQFKQPCLDTCGTGGDASHSINLSTLSSVVMAAAGVCVLKHGNRAITSRCGSSDLLAAFGYNLNAGISQVLASARQIKMGYFHAPAVHPVYARFQGLRRSLRVRTLFNLLGPVLNPVAVSYQLLGTAELRLLKLYETLLPKIGRKRALVFMGAEGMDEITSLGSTQGVLLNGTKTQKWVLNPLKFGFKKGKKSELQIHSVEHAKKRSVAILKNKQLGTARDSVVLSAAAGIFVFDERVSFSEAVCQAKQAVDSGKAWVVLNELVRISNL
ncbi:MAG TPA: anthranilate phosphoribosyltransferase [Candidatus Omnitrophica bacterium]|nr:anthranilate phosphoribosyltransferase [Candidatus Omnitrophota bacterium]